MEKEPGMSGESFSADKKIETADFHVDLLTPELYQDARERKGQLSEDGLRKLDFAFISIFRRWNKEDPSTFKTKLHEILDLFYRGHNYRIIERPEDLQLKGQKAVLHLEGGDLIQDINDLDELYAHKIRSIGILYSHDNALGGGCAGDLERGLTNFGKAVVNKMLKQKMIIDLSHANHKTIEDAIDIIEEKQKSPVYTHGGIYAKEANIEELDQSGLGQRLLLPRLARRIIKAGGVIGFTPCRAFFPSLHNLIAQMDRTVQEAGSTKHVAIGSDFGGFSLKDTLRGVEDIDKLSVIADVLYHKYNYSDEQIRDVMSGNIKRMIDESL